MHRFLALDHDNVINAHHVVHPPLLIAGSAVVQHGSLQHAKPIPSRLFRCLQRISQQRWPGVASKSDHYHVGNRCVGRGLGDRSMEECSRLQPLLAWLEFLNSHPCRCLSRNVTHRTGTPTTQGDGPAVAGDSTTQLLSATGGSLVRARVGLGC